MSLEQLQPTITPGAISWWPPAPGWWLLLILLPLMVWALIRLSRHLKQRQQPQNLEDSSLDPQRLAALSELASLVRPYEGRSAGPWLQQLNNVLKRLARAHYPEANSHVLNGREWLAFLDNHCPAAGLTRWMILVEGQYRNHVSLDDKSINGLNQAVDTWIRKHV